MRIVPASACARLTLAEVMDAVAEAFAAWDEGLAHLLPVAEGRGSDPGHHVAVKSGVVGPLGLIAVKAGAYVAANPARGLAAHVSTVLLLDDSTGAPVALVAASALNRMRTAAANGLATRHLARADSSVLGVIGAGRQAAMEAAAVCAVRPIRSILAATRSPATFARFAAEAEALTGIAPRHAGAAEIAEAADVIVTVTPSRAPLLTRAQIRPGTHISAMGADGAGKQELDPEILRDALVVCDIPAQSRSIGEAQHAVRLGMLDPAALEAATLGALLRGRIPGRREAGEITVFDSSGCALQDVAAAALALRRAVSDGSAIEVDF